jgi:GRIP domain
LSNIDSYREKELLQKISQLHQILRESQSDIERYESQVALLKLEVQKIDRIDKRQYVNLEYAKNIVLSFLESNTKTQLVPVVAQVLALSREETERVRLAVGDAPAKPSTTFGFF